MINNRKKVMDDEEDNEAEENEAGCKRSTSAILTFSSLMCSMSYLLSSSSTLSAWSWRGRGVPRALSGGFAWETGKLAVFGQGDQGAATTADGGAGCRSFVQSAGAAGGVLDRNSTLRQLNMRT